MEVQFPDVLLKFVISIRANMPANALIHQRHHRSRKDTVDKRGHVTLRFLGTLQHLNVGWRIGGQTILLYIVDDHVGVVTSDGKLVGQITLNPDRDYQPISRPSPT